MTNLEKVFLVVFIVLIILAIVVFSYQAIKVKEAKNQIPEVKNDTTNTRIINFITPQKSICNTWDEIIYQNYIAKHTPKEIAKRGCGRYYRVVENQLVEISKQEYDYIKNNNVAI